MPAVESEGVSSGGDEIHCQKTFAHGLAQLRIAPGQTLIVRRRSRPRQRPPGFRTRTSAGDRHQQKVAPRRQPGRLRVEEAQTTRRRNGKSSAPAT